MQNTLIVTVILVMMMMVIVMVLSRRRRGVVLYCQTCKIDNLIRFLIATGALRGLVTSRRQLTVT